jgi:hypothetical protein
MHCVSSATAFPRIEESLSGQAQISEYLYSNRLTAAACEGRLVTESLIRNAPDPRHCVLALSRPKVVQPLRYETRQTSLSPKPASTLLNNNGWPFHPEGKQSSAVAESKTHAVVILPRRVRSVGLSIESELNSTSRSLAWTWNSHLTRTNTNRRTFKYSSRRGWRFPARRCIRHFSAGPWTFFFVASSERLHGTVAAQVRNRIASRYFPWKQSGKACTYG